MNDQTRSLGQVIDQQPILTDRERGRLDIGSGRPLLGNGLPDMEFTTTGMTPERPNAYKDSWPIPTCPQPDFQWGLRDRKALCDMIDEAYDEIIRWKHNIFLLPSGSVGKSFVREITSLLQALAV